MMKRMFTSTTLALALIAATSVRPAEVAAYGVSDQEAAPAGPCMIYCLSCETHHVIECPSSDATVA